jgi:hypothetical protein
MNGAVVPMWQLGKTAIFISMDSAAGSFAASVFKLHWL